MNRGADAFTIEPLTPARAPAAALMLARAFAANPLHRAAFGPSPIDRNESFFRAALVLMKGPTFVATDGSRIAGLVHWARAPQCQLAAMEKLQVMPVMIGALGLGSALKVGSWLSAWASHDPRDAHVHLGPIGVDPDAQGQGLGRRLMERYCGAIDLTGETGYLETDRPENVRFYERYGFSVTHEISVLGVPNFLMRRPAA
jgi:GNAT superfamily N-acetyltransferase